MSFKLFHKTREFIQNKNFAQAQQILNEIKKEQLAPAALKLASALQKLIDPHFQPSAGSEAQQFYNLDVIDEPSSYFGKAQTVWESLVNTIKMLPERTDRLSNSVKLVSHMERYFLWDVSQSNVINSPWIGIIHNPFDIPDSYITSFTNEMLFLTSLWQESQAFCKGLVTFNEHHKSLLVAYLGDSVPIFFIPPPTNEKRQFWNYDKFIKNNNKKLIHAGYFLRNLHAIYEFPALAGFDKYLLRYSEMPYFKVKLSLQTNAFLENSENKVVDTSVKEVGFLEDRYFSAWINENVVFLELFALGHCSTLYECIAKGVPVLVNRLAAIEDLLGKEYPLFYNSKQDIEGLLANPNTLLKAHEYLVELSTKQFLSVDQYAKKLASLPILKSSAKQDKHKVTVVTVVMNMPELLERTIKSVIAQNYSNLEYVVVDGGSTDNTVDIIKKYEKYINVWVSEPDKGIYDAMNKGGRLASGIWVNFLNAGDTFVSTNTVSDMFADVTLGDDLVYGHTIFQNKDGEKVVEAREPEHLWQAMVFNHNALFKKRDLLLEHPFSDRYKIVADSEFIIWCYTQGKTFKNVGFPINTYESGGYADMNSVMRTVERWKVVSDYKLKPQQQINDYYFQRLLWENSCKDYLEKTYKVKI
jgi:hypothetical protein